MKNAVILHGTLGSPEGNWFRWLERELTARGLTVWLPLLPHAEEPSLREWLEFVHANCPFALDDDTLVVGHSSGAVLALLLAQESPVPLGAVITVSAFTDQHGTCVATSWAPNARLFDVPFDWEKIVTQRRIISIHSDDDPYIPLEQAEWIAKKIGSKLVLLPGQGHFNLEKSDDYRKFPQLLKLAEQVLSRNAPQ